MPIPATSPVPPIPVTLRHFDLSHCSCLSFLPHFLRTNGAVWVLWGLALGPGLNGLIKVLIWCQIRTHLKDAQTLDAAALKAEVWTCYHSVVRFGPWTGYFERGIVAILVFLGQYQALAWVMVAKGFVLQAPLTSKELNGDYGYIRKAAYILGTFASFGGAIALALSMTHGQLPAGFSWK